MSIIHDYILEGSNIDLLGELLAAGEKPNISNRDGDTPLHVIALRDEVNPRDIYENLLLAGLLIRYGANVNAKNNLGKTPLLNAVEARNHRMAKFLLEENASVNERDIEGNTALHKAICNCHFSSLKETNVICYPDLHLVKTLLKFHPELDMINFRGLFPLMMAVKHQHLGIVQELLEHHASVNMSGSDGRRAIHEALEQESVNIYIVLELIRYGCRFNVRNVNNDTPMTVYINKLFNAPTNELQKARSIFKFFLFRHHTFTSDQTKLIEKLSQEKNCQFSQIVRNCETEISRMIRDPLSPKYSVYHIASCGFYGKSDFNVPIKCYDTLLNKLINSEYPMYCHLIVSGMCTPYLNNRFAEICSFVGHTSTEVSYFDVFYLLSFYLSRLDMLNMIIACQ